jgi:hypothetical protein
MIAIFGDIGQFSAKKLVIWRFILLNDGVIDFWHKPSACFESIFDIVGCKNI